MLTSAAKADRTLVAALTANAVSSLKWENTPVDHWDDYMKLFEGSWNGTVMPPTPGLSSYSVRTFFDEIERQLYYEFKPEFRPEFLEFMKIVEREQPDQILHRSRVLAVSAGPLRVAELARKDVGRDKYGPEIKRMAMPESIAKRLLEGLVSITIRRMTVDMPYIRRYIVEHEKSSAGMGLKWADLAVLEDDDWHVILNLLIPKLQSLTGEAYGKWFTKPYNMGIRARSPELTSPQLSTGYTGAVDRSRIVSFLFELSCWSVFIPDKASWYRECIEFACRLYGVDPKNIVTPLVEGGMIYVTASKLFGAGKTLHCYDGKQFESVVGMILGIPFRPLMMNAHGLMEGSGINWTTLLNTVTMIWCYSRVANGLLALILGDDLNLFTDDEHKPYAGEGFIEYQPADTEQMFILGVSYRHDFKRPRLQGIKFTVDNGAKAIHHPIFGEWGDWHPVKGKHSQVTQALWYSMHFGEFGKRSLIEAIESIPATEFRGPGEMLQAMPELAGQTQTLSEALKWADSWGLAVA